MSPLPLSWAITRPRPAVDAVLATGPAQVSATFNEHLQTAFAAMTVVGPDENLWSTGEPRVDGAVISIDVMPLGPAGTYTVKLSGDLRRRSRCVGFVAVPLDYSGHRPPWATGRGGGRFRTRNTLKAKEVRRSPLPCHGYIARLRGAYEMGRGDAITAVGPETTAGVSK